MVGACGTWKEDETEETRDIGGTGSSRSLWAMRRGRDPAQFVCQAGSLVSRQQWAEETGLGPGSIDRRGGFESLF